MVVVLDLIRILFVQKLLGTVFLVDSISCAYVCVFWDFLYPKSGCVEFNRFVAPPLGLKIFVCLLSRHFISLKTKAKDPKPQGSSSSPGPLVSGPLDFEGSAGLEISSGADFSLLEQRG